MKYKLCIIFSYAILSYLLWYAYQVEKRDFKKFSLHYNNNASIKESLNDLEVSSNYENEYPKWRRCLILSFISSVLIYLLVQKITLIDLLLIILCVFIIFYSSTNFYNYHYYNINIKETKNIIQKIRRDLNLTN